MVEAKETDKISDSKKTESKASDGARSEASKSANEHNERLRDEKKKWEDPGRKPSDLTRGRAYPASKALLEQLAESDAKSAGKSKSTDKDHSSKSTTGDNSQSSTAGDKAHSSTSGDKGLAAPVPAAEVNHQGDALSKSTSRKVEEKTPVSLDSAGNVVKVNYPDGQSREFKHDSANNLTEVKDKEHTWHLKGFGNPRSNGDLWENEKNQWWEGTFQVDKQGRFRQEDKHGASIEDANGKRNYEAPKEILHKAADDIYKELHGFGTVDKEVIFKSLKDRSPSELAEIQKYYKEKHNEELRDDLGKSYITFHEADKKQAISMLDHQPGKDAPKNAQVDDHDNITRIDYPNGSARTFKYNQDGKLCDIQDKEHHWSTTDGTKWTNEKGDKWEGSVHVSKNGDFCRSNNEELIVDTAKGQRQETSALALQRSAEAINQQLNGRGSIVPEVIFANLENKTPAELAYIKEHFKNTTGVDLEKSLNQWKLTLSAGEQDRATNLLNHGFKGDSFKDAAMVHEKLTEMGQNKFEGPNQFVIEKELRLLVSSKTPEQLKQMETAYAEENPLHNLKDDILSNSKLSEATKESLKIYLEAQGKLEDSDRKKLADIALNAKDIGLLEEAFYKSSDKFRKDFANTDGPDRAFKAFAGYNPKVGMHNANETTLRAERIISSGDFKLTERLRDSDSDRAIQNNIDSMTDVQRKQFSNGSATFNDKMTLEQRFNFLAGNEDVRKHFFDKGQPGENLSLSEQQKKDLHFYREIHTALEESKQASYLSSKIFGSNLPEWEKRITKTEDEKPLFKSIEEHVHSIGSNDKQGIVDALKAISAEDQKNLLNPDGKFAHELDEKLKATLGEEDPCYKAAQLIIKDLKTGKDQQQNAPLTDLYMHLSTQSQNGHDGPGTGWKDDALRDLERAYKNPELKDSIQSKETRDLLRKSFGEKDYNRYVVPMLEKGQLDLATRTELNHNFDSSPMKLVTGTDKQSIYKNILSATPAEQDLLRVDLNKEPNNIVAKQLQEKVFANMSTDDIAIAKNIMEHGQMRPEDELRMHVIAGRNIEIQSSLSVMHAESKANYEATYGNLAQDILPKFGASKRDEISRLINPPSSSGDEQRAGMREWERSRAGAFSGSSDVAATQADQNLQKYLQSNADQIASMTPSQREDFRKQLLDSIETFRASKGAAADKASIAAAAAIATVLAPEAAPLTLAWAQTALAAGATGFVVKPLVQKAFRGTEFELKDEAVKTGVSGSIDVLGNVLGSSEALSLAAKCGINPNTVMKVALLRAVGNAGTSGAGVVANEMVANYKEGMTGEQLLRTCIDKGIPAAVMGGVSSLGASGLSELMREVKTVAPRPLPQILSAEQKAAALAKTHVESGPAYQANNAGLNVAITRIADASAGGGKVIQQILIKRQKERPAHP